MARGIDSFNDKGIEWAKSVIKYLEHARRL